MARAGGPSTTLLCEISKVVLLWTALRHRVPSWVVERSSERAVPMQSTLIAIDTSQHHFTLHGIDAAGKPVLRRELKRQQMEPFFSKLPATEVVLEACGGSHHWVVCSPDWGTRSG